MDDATKRHDEDRAWLRGERSWNNRMMEAEDPSFPGARQHTLIAIEQADAATCKAAYWRTRARLEGMLEASPTPADYSPALDATEKLAAVVEAAQKVLPRMVEGHWQVPIREQHLVLELEAALATLEQQQERGDSDETR